MSETSGGSSKPHCFELYSALGNEVIKACKTDADGKVVEGELENWCWDVFISSNHF